jgi:chromosome segregation ATPase
LITRRVTRVGSLKAEAETCILRICRRYSQTVALYDELIAAISAARALVPAIDRRAEATLDAIADFGLELKENAEAVAEARDIGDSIALGFEVLRRELRNAQRRADIERARLRRVSREATINFDLRRRDFEKHPTEWHHRMQLAARHVESTSARIDAIVFRVGLELRRVACWVELPDQQHELEAVLEDVEGRYSEDVLAELDPVLRNRYNQSITRVHRLLRLSRSIPARFFQWLKK